jgi:hypothetical protein
MQRPLFYFAFLLLLPQIVLAENTVIVGRVVSMEYAHVEVHCPADQICLDVWTRWEIVVERTLSGPVPNRKLQVAHLQHQLWPFKRNETVLLLLAPIDSEAEKRKLHASYYLQDVSRTQQMTCIDRPPQEARLHVDADKVYTNVPKSEFCFDMKDVGPW